MLRRLLVPVAVVAAVVAVAAIGGSLYLTTCFPRVAPAAPLTVSATPALIARGAYLFHHGAACAACHSQRDGSRTYGPVMPGTEGQGGERFGAEEGVPGVVFASNLTPAALATWTDGELRRALIAGVSRDGRPLFPLMPWSHYAHLGEDDLAALIAYLRTLPPKDHVVPASSLQFPMNLIVRTLPTDATPPAHAPHPGDAAYPAYVVNAAACLHCHSPADHGTPLPGREFSGGVPFQVPGFGTVFSANLTPDRDTGLGSWTKPAFIARFRAAAELATHPVPAKGFNSAMPWASYAGMTDEDLGAIYDYLRTVPAVSHRVPAPVLAP